MEKMRQEKHQKEFQLAVKEREKLENECREILERKERERR